MENAELQTDEDVLEPDQTGAESAPAEQQDQEQKAPEGFIAQDKHQKEVNKQHFKYREEERAKKALQEERDKLREELESLKTQSQDVEVPPIPDPLDDDYEDKIRARDAAIQQKAQHDQQIQSKQLAQQEAEQKAQQQKDDELKEKIAGFDSNTLKIGLDPAKVKQSANTIINYGVSEAVEDLVLEDPDGPLLVQYLAENPLELESLNQMSVYGVMTKVSELKERASRYRPKTSNAPDPPETLDGGGVGEIDDPSLKGVTFY